MQFDPKFMQNSEGNTTKKPKDKTSPKTYTFVAHS